ncbi:MAG: DUF2202 domain-containing protein [Akkermansiaceae bacterium]|nr:DUF2202 domain-containing protein [Akkermansiaceae bacterium]MCF7730424.1 DUF2202 domain-containing protein [Akkermansiaceae bacterium]
MKSLILTTIGLFAIATTAVAAAGPNELIRLYEEEILAHDLYVALGKKFPEVMPLKNIPQSELRHREALAAILKAEGIALPTPAGKRRFVSKGLNATFAKWLAAGQQSAAAACLAGVRLEDHDIADLRKAQLDFPKHKAVLAALEAASGNHLRAFHRNLTVRGGTYTPEAIPADDFKAILNGPHSRPGACGAGCGTNGCGQGK